MRFFQVWFVDDAGECILVVTYTTKYQALKHRDDIKPLHPNAFITAVEAILYTP